ncbi:class I SAM-dependent methyltransferase [Desulfuribacillus alkaliarsenatis]|uniref:Methyltransferase type 11 domain-containing protein n=1 Tax=Desulfuribacillus alkaliarsenatis TaxID=766136 RepID=A0A1E5G0S7_9FIRM|nr:class I SAM-dependent methyltransferase [Desulfuribacillus alkaliarsenatis]OEF96506.1 hypothetical protein BHF68_07580 [Desulfuribacillus alkaliarsenatis]
MGKAELTRPISAKDVEEVTGIEVDLRDFSVADSSDVLDVGAGGEAVIFRSIRKDIFGLEAAEEEIDATKEKGIEDAVGAKIHWIQGDAREMPLDDESFDVVTSFFTCMYLREQESKQQFFNECFRVLRSGGEVHLWDFSIKTDKQVFVGKLKIFLPDNEVVNASYGLGGESKEQTLEAIIDYATKAGFVCEKQELKCPSFYIKFKKP